MGVGAMSCVQQVGFGQTAFQLAASVGVMRERCRRWGRSIEKQSCYRRLNASMVYLSSEYFPGPLGFIILPICSMILWEKALSETCAATA